MEPIPMETMDDPNQEIGRVTRSKEEARKSYNRLSRWYGMLAGPFERKCRIRGLRKLRAGEKETVLEIGFGTGKGIQALARSVGSSGMVYGIDISDGMLTVTLSRLRRLGLEKRVVLKRGDAAALPFGSNGIDAVFMSFTLELFDTPEIPIVLGECRRVVRKNGRICVVAMSKEQNPGLLARLYQWAHCRYPGLIDCRPIYVEDALKDAGFSILDAEIVSLAGLPVGIVLAAKP